MTGYTLEREHHDPFADTCYACGAPKIATGSNVVRIHRPGCSYAANRMGVQTGLLPEVPR